MVVQTEKRLLWHPRKENTFIVGGGSQITLYEWVPETSEIKHVTSQQDLSLMKCFAWSPDASFSDLIAVGLSTGRVDLLRLEATRYARKHVLSSGPTVSLPVRNSRSCNALAFAPVDPNYLAVGLDKVRGDSSLVIWDISSAKPSLTLSSALPPSAQSPDQAEARPPAQSPARTSVQLPRGEVAPRADTRILQQYAATEVVSSLSFVPNSTLLLAGVSHRWLRLFDIRNLLTQPLTVASKVHGLATDPFDAHRVASFGDGAVTIWDVRRLAQPLLTFTERDAAADGAKPKIASAFTTVEFSSTRRGMIATLERDANHVRFWNLQQAEALEVSLDGAFTKEREREHSGKASRLWSNPSSILPWTGSNTAPTTPVDSPTQSNNGLVLSDTRKTKGFSRALSSFALVPANVAHPLTSNIMVVNPSGDLELYAVHDTPMYTPWSARGALYVGLGTSFRVLPGFTDTAAPPEPWDILMQPSVSAAVSRAHSVDQASLRRRGASESGTRTPPPMFGRGDEDGFPALSAASSRSRPRTPANLEATRPGRTRAYSPSALRNLHLEHPPSGDVDRANNARGDAPQKGPAVHSGDVYKKRSLSRYAKEPTGRKVSGSVTMLHVIEEDISMVMRKRVIRGYGLINPLHNASVVRETAEEETALAELWLWMHHVYEFLSIPDPRIDDYNFSYQGILGLWEGFRPSHPRTSAHPTPRMPTRTALSDIPAHISTTLSAEVHARRSASKHSTRRKSHPPASLVTEEFLSALNTLSERRAFGGDSTWKPPVTTSKLVQRRCALQLCGWGLAEDELGYAVRRWEKENKHSQAACWLAFTGQYKQAVELLMRSKDEMHHMMSGMLAALTPATLGTTPRNPDLLEHCERLVVRLQDPYLRAMLSYVTVKDWTEVLEEDALPLRERLAIALQFLEDADVTRYLQKVVDRCSHHGDIEGIIVTGLTSSGMDILQSYLDTTGDVQTAAIMSSLAPSQAQDPRVKRWLDSYRDILDAWKLFHHRSQFDIDRGRILHDAIQHEDLPPFEWAPRQILIRCNYCNKTIDSLPSEMNNPRTTACPHCGRPLPRCSICLMTLNVVQDSVRNAELARSSSGDTIDDAIVFCQTCRHGGHASHILQWFYGEDGSPAHPTCAVVGCDCRCADEF